MKRTTLTILFLLSLKAPIIHSAPINLVYNGDFAQSLAGWQFIDNCQTNFGYNAVWVENEKAYVHSNRVGSGGQGYLIQNFSQKIMPTRFYVDYQQVVGTGCGSIFFALTKDGTYKEPFLEFMVGESDKEGHYTRIDFLGQSYFFEDHARDFESGVFEAIFNYQNMQIIAQVTSDVGTRSFTIPIPSLNSVLTRGVYIGAGNPCWDGRNDQEGCFDNIVLEGSPFIIPATIDVDPDTLNINSKGKWITCYIELSEGYDVDNINISTVFLNDQVSAQSHPTGIGDHDNDGVPDLMVKFDRSAVQQILQVGDNVEITVTGELNDGTPFEGSDTIRVIDKGGKK